jgi:RimJ/RimL family protein N-acetyltransferase
LKNGRVVYTRSVRSTDAPLFMTFINGLSAQSRDFMHGWAIQCAPENAKGWTETLAAKADSEDHFALVALANDKAEERIVGYCWIDGVTTGRCLGDLPGLGIGIVDAYHGRGLGRELMRRVLATARERLHLARVRLGVFTDNPRAIHTYEAVGFRQDPDMPSKDFGGRTEVYMVVCLET